MQISIQNFGKRYKANPNNYSIPEFQRMFQWKPPQIEKFFDSILRNFPLPRFFVWELNHDTNKALTLYQLPNKFLNTKGTKSGDKVPNGIPTTAICDGQQRLTSILIGINGLSYSDGKEAKFLYFNVLCGIHKTKQTEISEDLDVDDKKIITFKFLTEKEAQTEVHPNTFFIKVKELYNKIDEYYISSDNDILSKMLEEYNFLSYGYYNNQIKEDAVNTILFLFRRFKQDYFDFVDIGEAIGNDYHDIVEFFLRINNENKPLTKNQILYSLLCMYFELDEFKDIDLKKDFEEITELVESKSIFKGGDGTYEFFLRAALYSSTDIILFKKDTFLPSHAVAILRDWPRIKISIIKTIKLVTELNLDKIITSVNSLIPVVFHFFKKYNQVSVEDKREILKYIVRAQFSNVFGSHGDTLLLALRNAQKNSFANNPDYAFSLIDLNNSLNGRKDKKSFNLNETEIVALSETKYKDKKVRPLLNLIYNNANFNVRFEIDHFHPADICRVKAKLDLYQVDQGDHVKIKATYDNLPNLQLLKAECNNEKRAKPIVKWIEGILNKRTDLSCLNGKDNFKDYILDNKIYLPDGDEYDTEEGVKAFISIENYVQFYETRKRYFQYLLWEELGDYDVLKNPFA